MKQVTTGDLVGEAVEHLAEAFQVPWFRDEEAARAIVYCRTKTTTRTIAEALGCLCYCADSGTDEEKAGILDSWMRGESRTIVATSAFVDGIDYPYVRMVFHVEAPDTAVEFAQAVGRAGRDGGYALSYVFLSRGWRASVRDRSGELLDSNARCMQRYLDFPRCRVAALSVFLDGKVTFCGQDTTMCDRCAELGVVEGRDLGIRDEADPDQHVWGREGGEEGNEGERRVQQDMMEEEGRRLEFMQRLELVRGMCMVCLAQGKLEGRTHSLEGCTSSVKQRFFRAKKRANEQGRQNGGSGWMAAYSGCFRCGLGQEMCSRQGQEGCRYKDVVMPLAWGAVLDEKWWEVVEQVMKKSMGQEERYMEWLGKGRRVFGEGSSNMVAVAEAMLGGIVGWFGEWTEIESQG